MQTPWSVWVAVVQPYEAKCRRHVPHCSLQRKAGSTSLPIMSTKRTTGNKAASACATAIFITTKQPLYPLRAEPACNTVSKPRTLLRDPRRPSVTIQCCYNACIQPPSLIPFQQRSSPPVRHSSADCRAVESRYWAQRQSERK